MDEVTTKLSIRLKLYDNSSRKFITRNCHRCRRRFHTPLLFQMQCFKKVLLTEAKPFGSMQNTFAPSPFNDDHGKLASVRLKRLSQSNPVLFISTQVFQLFREINRVKFILLPTFHVLTYLKVVFIVHLRNIVNKTEVSIFYVFTTFFTMREYKSIYQQYLPALAVEPRNCRFQFA